MTSKSKWRGHPIVFDGWKWVYEDTEEKVAFSKRPCGNCGKMQTEEGHDGCLGTLIGVMNACCGHGETNEAYVQFLDRTSIHGEDAIVVLDILKKNSKEERDGN